jgi:hypothetical protein
VIDVAGTNAVRLELGLSVLELWLAYLALGGSRNAGDLGTYLEGGHRPWTGFDPWTGDGSADDDMIVLALNEEASRQGSATMLTYGRP